MSAAVKADVAAALLAGTLSSPALANGQGRIDTRSGMKQDLNDPAISGDFDYGVFRGTDPDCYHDWVGEERENRVLIYTRTAGPRHANLGPRLAAGMNPPLAAGNVVQNSLKRWLEAEGIVVDWTEDVTRL